MTNTVRPPSSPGKCLTTNGVRQNSILLPILYKRKCRTGYVLRHEGVKVNNAKSEEQPVTSGVPQGSVLDPTLFIYFINNLPKESIVSTKNFADDTKVYTEIESDKDRESLQETVDKM